MEKKKEEIEKLWEQGCILIRTVPDKKEMEVMNKGTFIELLQSLTTPSSLPTDGEIDVVAKEWFENNRKFFTPTDRDLSEFKSIYKLALRTNFPSAKCEGSEDLALKNLSEITQEELEQINEILNIKNSAFGIPLKTWRDLEYQCFSKSHAIFSGYCVIKVYEFLKSKGYKINPPKQNG